MSSDQMPAPGKIKLIKFPPPGQEKTSNARGMPGGGDVEASIWLIHNKMKTRAIKNLLRLWYLNILSNSGPNIAKAKQILR